MKQFGILNIIEEVRDAGTPKMKQAVLEKYKDNDMLKKVLYYTYNPYMKYKITEKTFNDYDGSGASDFNGTLYELLEILAISNINDTLKHTVVKYLDIFYGSEFKDLIKCIFMKDLKLGISDSTINKVWKGLIPGFEVQLAKKYSDVKLEKDEKIFLTEKLDGIRCVCFIKTNRTVEFYTRQGKQIFGLLDIENDLLIDKFEEDLVIDGELLFNGEYENSGDQYKKTTKIVNSKQEHKKDITFHMFDILSLAEFKNGKSELVYSDRQKALSMIRESDNVKKVQVLYAGKDHTQIMDWHKIMVDGGREGLMLNRNKPYECKRTSSLLKVKTMLDVDLKVVDFEEGEGEIQGKLGALVVDYKGYKVNVGSGYTKEQREDFWKNNENMIGKIIKVQYFEETSNQQGGLSLRFPVFLEIRNDKTEESYN